MERLKRCETVFPTLFTCSTGRRTSAIRWSKPTVLSPFGEKGRLASWDRARIEESSRNGLQYLTRHGILDNDSPNILHRAPKHRVEAYLGISIAVEQKVRWGKFSAQRINPTGDSRRVFQESVQIARIQAITCATATAVIILVSFQQIAMRLHMAKPKVKQLPRATEIKGMYFNPKTDEVEINYVGVAGWYVLKVPVEEIFKTEEWFISIRENIGKSWRMRKEGVPE